MVRERASEIVRNDLVQEKMAAGSNPCRHLYVKVFELTVLIGSHRIILVVHFLWVYVIMNMK